jgi:hypothetical protein
VTRQLGESGAPARSPLLRRAGARLVPYLPALAVSAVLGWICVGAIRAAAGEPAAPLDDTFIHLNFARRLAEGSFFAYVPGEGYVSGATSLLWPLLLAPFHALGLRGLSLLWAAWLLGGLAHAALTVEIYRLTRRLAGAGAAFGAAATGALFPAFVWFAWSGMETMALAWILLRAARVAAAYVEPEPGHPPPSVAAVIAVGLVAPLIRPEGALASLLAAIALVLRPAGSRWGAPAPGPGPSAAALGAPAPGLRSSAAAPGPVRARLLALVPLAGLLVVPLLNLGFTGHATSATAQVKWAIGNPHYALGNLLTLAIYNARILWTNILDGRDWTWIFLPEHAALPILLGALALPFAGARRRLPVHALFVGLVALGVFVPCTYLSFLWNRIRYVWPFAGALCVLLGCLAREVSDRVRRFAPRVTFVAPILAGALAGAAALRLPWAVRDLAQSAAAVDKQQVKLARWAKATLPADAVLGVNDTGALAYLSDRKTFDVVGLTTEGEARYWVAGAGSRFEHYEKLPRARLPTHFIVYPQWMSCPPVLGAVLTEATVTDQSILGGATMVAHEARWDLLGSGALPVAPPADLDLVDEVDVADLESEAAHGFDRAETWDVDDQCKLALVAGRVVADGGRVNRARDRFQVRWPAGKAATLVLRVDADWPLALTVAVAGQAVGTVKLSGDGGFTEPALALPAGPGGEVTVTASGPGAGGEAARFGSFHYWVYAAR